MQRSIHVLAALLLVLVAPVAQSQSPTVGPLTADEVPVEEPTFCFVPVDQVVLADVTLADSTVEQSETTLNLILGEAGELDRLSLIVSTLGTTFGDTGIISVFWDPESGSTQTVDPVTSQTVIQFTAAVHYPMIDNEFGMVPVDFDFFTGHEEGFTGSLTFLLDPDGGVSTAALSLQLAEPLLGVVQSIDVHDIPLDKVFGFPSTPTEPLPTDLSEILRAAKAEKSCPREKRCKEKELCLQPIVIAEDNGANPTSCPNFQATIDIWAKCCKQIVVKAKKTINKTSLQKLTVTPPSLSAEARDLISRMTDDNNRAPNNACVEVYCVARFQDASGMDDEDLWGGAFAVNGGNAGARVVVQSDSHPNNVAHEVGHAVGLPHPPANDGTVMHPSGANQTGVSDQQSKSNCQKGIKGNCKDRKPHTNCCKSWELNQ